MRLDKYLCDLDIGTRSEVKEIIRKRRIAINGNICNDPSTHVAEDDIITMDGEPLTYEKERYYILNKPQGVITATEDANSRTVMDLMSDINTKGLFPVGRLDKDTEGLLLITNDGALSHQLLSPRKHVEKCYYVELESRYTKDDIAMLENGVDIGDDELTLEAKVEPITPTSLYLTITEGRYHQVKRMMSAIDNRVTFLKRVSFGALELDPSLAQGQYRQLDDDEIFLLKYRSNA